MCVVVNEIINIQIIINWISENGLQILLQDRDW